MNLEVKSATEVNKKIFRIKPLPRDGLVFRIHHTDQNSKKIRFLHTTFNQKTAVLASSDNEGNVYLVDFANNKFWGLPTVNSCTVLKFSPYRDNEILIGLKNGCVIIVNIEVAKISGHFTGHVYPVNNLSFSSSFLCISSSLNEAIIWDLKTNTKVQVLTLEENCVLKHVVFMPVSNNILACYNDDVINIWKSDSFENCKYILPSVWNNFSLKNVTFTLDGNFIIISGYSATIALFSLNKWKPIKFITLPEYIKTIRNIKVLPNEIDSSVLIILSGNGAIYFYDMKENIILSELKINHEIIKFDFLIEKQLLAVILCSGEVKIFNFEKYIEKPIVVSAKSSDIPIKKSFRPRKIKTLNLGYLHDEMSDVLEIDKLKSILKAYGEYPTAYRTKIWEQLLQLPNSDKQFDSIINNTTVTCFENLEKQYPLKDTRHLKNLKSLLANLVTWCNFFSNVEYLPVFVFPFVKIFQSKPVILFEVAVTVLVNWCQYWFEYFPLPPINILALVENLLLEHDPELLDFLNAKEITSKIYAWPLLESAFSEALTSNSWAVFWDHVLTLEPSFLLCGVVAYNIMQRNSLLTLIEINEFELFYHQQNPIDVKKFIAKCYFILEKTSAKVHPRQYLNMFQKLQPDKYPVFEAYPKIFVQQHSQKIELLKNDMTKMKKEEADLLHEKTDEIDRIIKLDFDSIEKERLLEMKRAYNETLRQQQKQAKEQLNKITDLRKKLQNEQKDLVKYSQTAISLQKRSQRQSYQSLLQELETDKERYEYETQKAEDLLIRHYSGLVKHKLRIDELVQESKNASVGEKSSFNELKKHRKKLSDEIEQIKKSVESSDLLKQINLATSIATMDDLIGKVQTELNQELKKEVQNINKSEASLKAMQLEAETKELELEVSNLMNSLAKNKLNYQKNRESFHNLTLEKSISNNSKDSDVTLANTVIFVPKEGEKDQPNDVKSVRFLNVSDTPKSSF